MHIEQENGQFALHIQDEIILLNRDEVQTLNNITAFALMDEDFDKEEE